MNSRLLAALLAACTMGLMASGCASFRSAPEETEPARQSARPDLAEARLADAAERAEAALMSLARVRAARFPASVAGAPSEVPAALLRPVTLDWIGPLESLAGTLAAHAGYRFAEAGAAPARPVMVDIRAANEPLIEVLRDAGLQAGAAATLVVDAGGRVVRLDWTGEHPDTAPGARNE